MKFLRIATIALLLAMVFCAVSQAQQKPARFKVKSVNFVANEAFSTAQLRKVMVTHKSGFLSHYYFRRSVYDDDLKTLELFYHQNGYLDAMVVDNAVTFDSTHHTVSIQIQMYEGPLTHLRGIFMYGNHAFSDTLLLSFVKLKPGDPFEQPLIQLGTSSIVQLYANNGYLDAEIRPDIRIDSTQHLALVDLQVVEGPQYHVEQIRYDGMAKTRTFVVRRELTFKPGQVVSLSKLLDSQRRLYLLGIFQSVFIRPVDPASGDSTGKDILVQAAEAKSWQVNASIGYGTVEMGRGHLDVTQVNLLGTGRKIGVSGSISFINRSLELGYTAPWTFGLPWRTDIKGDYEFLRQPSYDVTRRSINLITAHNLGRRLMVSTTYRIEDSHLSNIKVASVPPSMTASVSSIKPAATWDTRDDIFNTKKGLYLEVSEELAGTFLGGNNNFLRHLVNFRYFKSFGPNTVIGTAAQAGLINDLGDTAHIALSERFYAGGPNVMRGFSYQHLGPKDVSGVPIGGTVELLFNLVEVRQVVFKIVGAAAFVDVGNIWSKADDFRLKDLRTTPGLGLRIGTPIGIIRGDFGFNVRPRYNEPPWRFYFAVGQAF